MITPAEFLLAVASKPDSELVVRMGTVDPAYTSGRPTIIFDGETVASVKTYPYLASYTPVASHRVLLLRAGHAWVVLGRIL